LWDFDLGGVLPFGHRYIVEDEEFLLAMATDEPTSIGPLELGGERISGLLAAVGACQHRAFVLPATSMQEKNRCPFRSLRVRSIYRAKGSKSIICWS
jgi:hypothetical protein